MKTTGFWLIVCVLPMLTSSGCKTMSEVAYAVGHVLDPDAGQCPADAADCALCGLPPGVSPDIYGLGGAQDHPHQVPLDGHRAGQPPYASSGHVRGSSGSRAHPDGAPGPPVDALGAELASRNAELIQARADLLRVQSEVQSVQQDLEVSWRQEMAQFQQQLQVRDRQRQDALGDVAGSVAKLVEESAR